MIVRFWGSELQLRHSQPQKTSYDNYTAGIAASGAIQHDPAFSTSYTTRGNLTATQIWRNTDGATLTTRNQFDDAGNILSTTDPLNHTTNFSYADSWGNSACAPATGSTKAYRTTVTNPLSQTTKATFNSCSGTTASSTDRNNLTTSFSYDLLNRLTQTNSPDGGQTTLCYSDTAGSPCYSAALPLTVTTTKKINTTQNLTSLLKVDGFGRAVQTTLTSDPDGPTYVDTAYDALGRVYCVSNPYRATSDSTYGITTHVYDALDRVTAVQPPDYWASTSASSPTCQNVSPSTTPANPTNFIATAYSGNTATVTDQAGKSRKSVTDALGRLTQVFEQPSDPNYNYSQPDHK